MYDVAIIGAGPAGLSAALNLKLHNKEIIWFGSPALSEKVGKSEKIANYPGLSIISGQELNQHFAAQMEEMALTLTDKMVTNIAQTRKGFMILGDNDVYEAKTVLLATGAAAAKGIEGEEDFLGRGVSYCATCDGFLYKGKTLAVFCQTERFEHEVAYLAELAEKIYLYAPYKGCSIDLPNVEILTSGMAKVTGGFKATGLVLRDGTELAVDGIFFLRSAVAPTTLFKGLEMEGPHIKVDRQMATNKKGCFAAGDCTGTPYQIAKAVGEGNIAAHAIIKYLSEGDNQ